MDEETFDAASVGVTHHCLVRWLERTKGVDLTAARTIVLSRSPSIKHVDRRVVELIEQEHGVGMDPLRQMIRDEIAGCEVAIVTMARNGGVRSYAVTTPDGRVFVVMRSDDDKGRVHSWYAPTMLEPGMDPV